MGECSPIVCGCFPAPSNGTLSTAFAVFQESLHVFCNDGYSLSQSSHIQTATYKCTSSGTYVIESPQGEEISDTSICHSRSCGQPPQVLNAIADRTSEVTFGESVTYTCDEGYTNGGVFGGNTFFSVACLSSGSFSTVASCSKTTYSVQVSTRDATKDDNSPGVSGATIRWHAGVLSGTALSSETGVMLQGLPAGPITLVAELEGYITTAEKIIYPEICTGTVYLVMTPEMGPKDWRIVLTWGAQPLDVDLHVYWGDEDSPYSHEVFWHKKSPGPGVAGDREGLDVDDTVSFGPETFTVSDWENCKVDSKACKLVVKVRNYSQSPQMTDVKVEFFNGDTLKRTFQMTDGNVMDPRNSQMVPAEIDWWVTTLKVDGTMEPCVPSGTSCETF